jgi:PAS domain S-box-containing protein
VALKGKKSRKETGLRRRAEERLASDVRALKGMPQDDVEKLVHELRVHELELEMQNEELRRAHDELEESRSKYADLYDFAPVGYVTLDEKGLILEANLTACGQLGVERRALIRKPFFAFMPDEGYRLFFKHLRDVFRNETEKTLELTLETRAGERFQGLLKSVFLRDSGGKASCRISILDITERRELEEQLVQAQKMEALGTLTGGIAHEFNNIMTVIMGFGEFLRQGLAKDSPLREYADQIGHAADRAARLTDGLLAYSRKKGVSLEHVDVNEALRAVAGLLENIIGEHITLKTAATDEALPVLADKTQLEQVLINLAVNAVDAMPGGGMLSLRAGLLESLHGIVDNQNRIPPGAYALITVSDTGSGMDRETQAKIFEPFFTTKEVGKGTGLGLSVVHGIIKNHNGHISVESEPGRGTMFRIYLPVAMKG